MKNLGTNLVPWDTYVLPFAQVTKASFVKRKEEDETIIQVVVGA